MLGGPDLVVLAGVALLVFGPKRLPELAKGLGKGIRDFKKALNEETSPRQEIPVQPVSPPQTSQTVAPSQSKEPEIHT